jgi:hypothetical protein
MPMPSSDVDAEGFGHGSGGFLKREYVDCSGTLLDDI